MIDARAGGWSPEQGRGIGGVHRRAAGIRRQRVGRLVHVHALAARSRIAQHPMDLVAGGGPIHRGHGGAPFDGRIVKVHVQTGETVRSGDPLVTLDCPEAASARAAVDTVTASLREARVALDRERRMLDQGIGIEREKLAAETRVAGLEAELHRAQAGAVFVGPGSGTTVIVRAPMAGIVITRKAVEGVAVQRGAEPLVEIGNPTAPWVVADVFERAITQ